MKQVCLSINPLPGHTCSLATASCWYLAVPAHILPLAIYLGRPCSVCKPLSMTLLLFGFLIVESGLDLLTFLPLQCVK